IYTIGSTGDNVYNFGTTNTSRPEYQTGWHFASLASRNVTWEVAKKQDIGFDLYLFNSKFSLTMDYFHEKRSGIYMLREFLPGSMGLESSPWANVGAVRSEGFDGNFAFNNRFGDVNLTVRGNITYAHNTILDHDVQNYTYPYQYLIGYRINQQRGLIAEGLFADYDDIRNHPKQMFGEVQPGDIKYKDVNGDGVVDANDEVAIGATSTPSLIYGFGASAQWRNFDINVHFQGSGKSTVMLRGKTVWAFSEDRYGQILSDLVDNRWVDAETAATLGIPANEDPNASYPRLVHLEGYASHNNYRNSSYWMRDISYLRLKNFEVGYNLPKSAIDAMHLENFRIYLQGTNLLTFSSFKLWDPEMGSDNGEKYPLSKTVTLGLQVNF
ncbi:MAG: SusC/RagA family TonB-linked outer membrane protein, partial [Muribaculaceae bacterium]|nr:SusC/RagA family TonB-linked outer membrane protein [Muribaculaceae bacterium]